MPLSVAKLFLFSQISTPEIEPVETTTSLESLDAESVTEENETSNKDHPEQEVQQIENHGFVNTTDSPNRTPQEKDDNQPQQKVDNDQV